MKSSSRSSKRKLKRSQKHSKKKTRSSREKTKKLKQRDQSVSCTDEDSVSNSSVSCSSPVEENRSKKRGRTRDRKCRKDKKRRKRSNLVSESSGDDSPCVKKLKKSKKTRGSDSRIKQNTKRQRRDRGMSPSSSRSANDDGELKVENVEPEERKGRKKRKERKRQKRGRSVSSSSSQSRSHSSCKAHENWERGFEGKEEKMELKERKGRDKCKESSSSKRIRDKSKSCSPCSLHSEGSYHSEERELEKNNPKRLKSVIVVMKETEVAEAQTSNRDDGHKDEIVCEFDDYPSKSNDSNDGFCGREALSDSHYVSTEKRSLEEPNREFVASDVGASEVLGIQREVAEGSGGMTSNYVKSGADDPLMGNRNEVCISNAGSIRGDLEAILRQKALENLLKRQGKSSTKIPADMKTDPDIEVKKFSAVKAQPVDQHIPHDEENIKSVHEAGKVADHVRSISNPPNPSKDNDGYLLSVEVETAHPDEKSKAPGVFVNSRPDVGVSTSRKELFGAKNTWKRQLSPQEISQKNLSVPKEMTANDSKQQLKSQECSQPKLSARQETTSEDSTLDSASLRFGPKGNTDKSAAVAASEPCASGEQSTNDKNNEADEEGQFQQKTMSVMRGGEMVQVSYKVYIPKKTPALARRQLKR